MSLKYDVASVLEREMHLKDPPSHRRLSFGIPELDKMLGGGVHEGDSVLVAGSSGPGKSVLGAPEKPSRSWWCTSTAVKE